jgi:hypothetical protein
MNNINYDGGTPRRNTLDNTDEQRVREILKETAVPQAPDRVTKAIRLIEGVKGRDTKMIITKRELIDLILKDNEESEQRVREILSKNKGELNAFCSMVRGELK